LVVVQTRKAAHTVLVVVVVRVLLVLLVLLRQHQVMVAQA
jgi:hypothetical protein